MIYPEMVLPSFLSDSCAWHLDCYRCSICVYHACSFLLLFVSELSVEHGWSNVVVYSIRVGIFAMDLLCIYAHVFYTLIILRVYYDLFIVLWSRVGYFCFCHAWWKKTAKTCV